MKYLPFDVTIAMVNSADNVLLKQALQTLAQDFDIYGIKARVSFTDFTVGEGPIEVGWAQSELTTAEIVEQRDATPQSQWDVTPNEQAARKVRVFGMSGGEGNETLNDGLPVWRKMFLRKPAAQVIAAVWALNRSGAQLTTGGLVHFTGDIVGRWK